MKFYYPLINLSMHYCAFLSNPSMAHRWMKRCLIIILLLNASVCFGFKGKVTHENKEAIISATISVYSEDSVLQANGITDTEGIYSFQNIRFPAILVFRHLLYEEKSVRLTEEPTDTLITVLKEKNNMLGEVTVNAELVKHYENRSSYKMLQKDMTNYSSFTQAMNVIPHMNVTSKGAISYKGDSNIVLLLNGAATTYEELQALSKEDISKVDIYENPPAQYALNGASCVLNVITKQNMTGGNIALYALDAFKPIYGNNNVSEAIVAVNPSIQLQKFFGNFHPRHERLLSEQQAGRHPIRLDEQAHPKHSLRLSATDRGLRQMELSGHCRCQIPQNRQ